MNKISCFIAVCFIFLPSFDEVNCDCVLSLKKDFGNPQPILLQNGGYLAPNATTGDVWVRRSESLTVACSGDKAFVVLGNFTTDAEVVEAKCLRESTFRVGRWIGEFRNITCTRTPNFVTEDSRKKCYRENKIINVGYRVNGELVKLYEACFDEGLVSTLYVKHQLTPGIVHVQGSGGGRPHFLAGDMFKNVKVSNLYKKKYYTERLNQILGADMAEKYLSQKQFITRGHLAPRADFPLQFEQRASFHYVNTGPQWQRGNAGDWAALEDALRRRVQSLGRPLIVYTGTSGVMTLRNAHGIHTPLYLHTDENNNQLLPVPLYYFKVVHNPRDKSAAAFISINSSFYNATEIGDLSFCSDICDENRNYSWLRWRSKDGTHSFCCTYEDFVKTIKHLPKLDVKEIFY